VLSGQRLTNPLSRVATCPRFQFFFGFGGDRLLAYRRSLWRRCDLALSVTELSQLLGFIDDRWPTVFRPNPVSGIRPFCVPLSMGASMRRVSVALICAICVIAFTHRASAADFNEPARPQLSPNCFLISSINIHTHFTDDIGRVTSDRVGRVR
jgi:hypothetical protein